MKQFIIFPLLFLGFGTAAQDIRMVKILSEDRGLEKRCNNCRSFVVLPANIPPNTAFIYLAISTNRTGHFNDLYLLNQVKHLTEEQPIKILGDLRPLVELITDCEEEGQVNFHVETDGHISGSNIFEKGDGYSCDDSKCRLNFPGGPAGFQVVQNKQEGTYYFGVENPSEKDDVYFHIEAVAVQRDY